MITIHLAKLKQIIYNLFSAELETLAAAKTLRNPLSLKFHLACIFQILQNPPKSTTIPLWLHHFKHISTAISQLEGVLLDWYSNKPSMAELDSSFSKGCWAKYLHHSSCRSIIFTCFKHWQAKSYWIFIYSSTVVSSRILCFSNLCHA